MLARVDVPAQKRQVGQGVRQANARSRHREPARNEMRGSAQVQRAFHHRVKQQDREQEKVDQLVHLRPHRAVQRGEAANQVATQNQRKVGEQQRQVVHAGEDNRSGCVIPAVRGLVRRA